MVSAPRSVPAELSGWGNYPVETCHLYRPNDLDALKTIVQHAPQPDLISRGQGRSYGDASLNASRGVMLQEGLNRILNFDAETGVLECEAGATLSEILDYIVPREFFLGITPGTKNISVGGAIAADVHGKNHHKEGTISHQLLAFSILIASGEILTCSRDENSDLFWVTLGGMGLTGVILTARLQMKAVESAYVRTRTERCRDLDDVLSRIDEGDRDFDYAVAWIDCLARGDSLGRSVLMRANPARLEELPPSLRSSPHSVPSKRSFGVPFSLPSGVLNSFSMRIFNAAFYAARRDRGAIADYDSYFYPLDRVADWNRIYGRRGALQYQVVLPRATARQGLIDILGETTADGHGSFLAVLKSTGPANPSPLSFPIEGISLALDFPNTGEKLLRLLRRLDELTLASGGRVYLAKDSTLEAEHFRAMYPRFDEFLALKAKYDPETRFSSSLARRLGLVRAD